MLFEQVSLGAQVIQLGYRNDVGTIVGIVDNDTVLVSWKSDDKKARPIENNIDELKLFNPEYDALIQIKLNEAKDAFQLAFDKLQEVVELNDGELMSVKYSDHIDVKELEYCLESNGWRSSSLWC